MEKGVSTIEEEEDDDDSDIDIDSDYDNDNDNDNNDTEKDQEMIAIYEIEKYLAVKRWKRKMQQILKGVLEGVQKEGDDRNDDDDDDNGGSGGVDDKILIALYEIEKYLAMQGKFVLKNYPYARDGMEIWKAIETWVSAYCNIFYKNNESVENDAEIQAWWSEIREEGHGDQKEGWYPLSNLGNLTMALTTLIWITSGLHAALNFGQYAYVGWPPNRPMLLRKPIPNHKQQREEDNQSPNQQERDDASTWLKPQVLPEKFDMAFVIAVMDVLSRHTSDELYLGQRPPSNEWKEYDQVNKKFEEFKKELVEIEKNIKERNKSYELMNMRLGTAKIPYKILYPDTSKANSYPNVKGGLSREDITGRGIPNSISI
ncbi:Lipoxygenase [Corchorus capsularis]|uniref:Lipoxygenase n=1 Tax=Corchorus capsularis TaxID=210143 RepID=A0A1R3IW51_COCAP|nr:Lipoxygenase [Corchorus capsularis]